MATAAEVAKKANIIVMLAPDTVQPRIYRESIEKEMGRGKTLMFAHGFSIHFSQIVPPVGVDVSMIAPKCPGHMLRRLYTEGLGPPALVAIHQDASGKAKDTALPMPRGLVALEPGFWKRLLLKRPRPTCSVSKQCFAAESRP